MQQDIQDFDNQRNFNVSYTASLCVRAYFYTALELRDAISSDQVTIQHQIALYNTGVEHTELSSADELNG